MVGACDGFDSTVPHSKIMLSIFAMLHEWFVDQLRSKVLRGMSDAFDLGKNIGRPGFGHKLVPKLDEAGRPVLDSHGDPVNEKVIDAEMAVWVLEAFTLYADRRWSPARIARHFNDLKVGGHEKWDVNHIVKMLGCDSYIGIEYYHKTYQERDPVTGKVTTFKRPPERMETARRASPADHSG
jgi:site-specific DNA recombinase